MGEDQVEEKGEVIRIVASLEIAVSELDGAAGHLIEKLTPVMKEIEEKGGTPPSPSTGNSLECLIGKDIAKQIDLLRSITDRVRETTLRVQL